jgi:hypothetical protein
VAEVERLLGRKLPDHSVPKEKRGTS